MVDIEFCRKSGCDYYFSGFDDCVYGDKNIPKDYLRMCKTSRYQVYLIDKENKKEGENQMNQTVTIIGKPEPFGKLSVDKEVLFYALLWATNASNKSPYKVIENIKLNLDKLSTYDLEFISKEIIDSGSWNLEYDGQQWQGFLDDLKKEIKRRE